MIRSSQITFGEANTGKAIATGEFLIEARRVLGIIIKRLWKKRKLTKYINTTGWRLRTTLNKRCIQCLAKQASGIVRGTRKKQEKRLWMIKKLQSEGKNCDALKKIYRETKVSCPLVGEANIQLDSRFFKVEFGSDGEFDGWVTLKGLFVNRGEKMVLPFHRHKHLNTLLDSGVLKNSIRLSNKAICFSFDIAKPKRARGKQAIGIDLRENKILTPSIGEAVIRDSHGHTMKSICEKLARKTKGSKAFGRAQLHRDNFINWSVKQINLTGVGTVNLERLRNFGSRSRELSHWTYGRIRRRLEARLEEHGVRVNLVNPVNTSRQCSSCNFVDKNSRDGQTFVCTNCGFADDADHNAAVNISRAGVYSPRKNHTVENFQ